MPNHKSFNVTLIHPATYVHSLALKEAADYLDATLRACGYRSVRTTNLVSQKAYNVIFCAHMLGREQVAKLPPDTIIFNSEQLEDSGGWYFKSGVYLDLLDRFFVWDYSSSNLSRVAHDRKSALPFLYCRELRRPDIVRSSGPSLLFYGSDSPRRRRILDALQASGVPLQVVFGQYADERDEKMLRSWAILNLHKHDGVAAFEPIRCFYPLINEVPVISEQVSDASAADFRDSMFFFDQASLVEGVRSLYRNPATFVERSRAMLASFKQTSPLARIAAAVEAFLRRWS
jgi:hypothetical protein